MEKDIKGKKFTREVTLEQVQVRAESDPNYLEFSFSSELPVERWWGKEILSHAPEAVNLERSTTMNFLWNHDRDVVLGRVESVEIGSDQRGYCKVRWSNRDSIKEYRQDVEDKILTNVSFAYQIDDYKELPNETYLCHWTPLEISLVSVPQDATVGIGRALSEDNIEKPNPTKKMELTQIREEETKRIASILELSRKYGNQPLADQLINDGATIEQARSQYLDQIVANQSPVAAVAPLGFSEKEEKSYSMLRGIQACLTGDWSKAGFERECSQEIARRSKKSPQGNSFFMPVRDLKVNYGQRATYAVGAAGTGGNLVETDLRAEDFIDALRNRAVVMQLGAQMLSGLEGNVDIPGQNAVTTTYWVGESGALTQSEATFRQVQLRPKTIGCLSRYSRLTLLQASIDIEQFIRRDFAAQMALGIDLAAISGTGLSNQPTGILNVSGIGAVVGDTNGAAPDWADIVNLETEVAVDNADVNVCSYLVNAKTRGKLKRTEKFGSTNGDPIWEVSGMDGMMNGYRAACSNQVPGNLTKGTGTSLSAIIFGDFSQLIVGEWGVLEILVNPYGETDYSKGDVAIRAFQTLDIAVRYAQSFAAMTDAITT